MYFYNNQKIREIREIKGYSKETLASEAKLTVATIWNIENGKSPKLESLIRIVNFLKIKIDDVIEYDPEHKEEPAKESIITSDNNIV